MLYKLNCCVCLFYDKYLNVARKEFTCYTSWDKLMWRF